MRRKQHKNLEKLLVEDYAAEGKSLARQDGKVIFIENVVPGDVVDVRLSKNKKDWAEGHPLYFHSYSNERVEPFCIHFGVCGGCQWQMLPYEKQLQYKQQQVYDNLKRIGKILLPELSPIVGADETRFYRNKLEYTFSTKQFLPAGTFNKEDKEQSFQNVLGFHAKGFFDKIVDIQQCWLQHDLTNSIRNSVRNYALENKISFYDIREHKGVLRIMQVRICTTGEVMVNLVFGDNASKKTDKILQFISDSFPQISSLLYTVNLKKNDSMHDLQPQLFKGKDHILEKLTTGEGQEYLFKIGSKSFFQTNTYQAEKLYRITKDFAELDVSKTLYDLYCGTGSIGIFCSKDAGKIIGVDITEAAIEDAKENAALNNIHHAQFFTGDVIEVCDDAFFELHGKPDVIITDPPRVGMHEKLVNKILDMQAPVVVYVSCNPATQARDLHLLDEKYSVIRVQPVDMFPHTHHIENIVQLKLK